MLWRLGCAALLLAFSVIVATGWTVYSNWQDSRRDTQIAASNRIYLRAINDMLGDLKDAETGQRGFVLTGRDHYLEPYTNALGSIESSLKTLSTVAEARPDQKEAIALIQAETHSKLHELALTIQLRREKGFDAALAEVLTDRGKAAMDAIRQQCKSISDVQSADLVRRTTQARDHQLDAITIGGIGAVVLSLLMLAGFITLASGANQQTRLAERLANSREIFETTLNSIGDGVISTDTTGRIIFMNPEAVNLTGWARNDAVGMLLSEVFQIVNESSRLKVESPFDKVMRTGGVVGLANHTTLIRKDSGEVPIDDSGAPIRNVKGTVSGVVIVFRNIAERRKTEAALQLSHREVLKANEELKQFSYAATHDLQEPLRTIVVFSQLLGRSYKEILDDRGQHLLQTVEEAANRMSSLIDDLLSYTRAGGIESGGNRASVNPNDILNDTIVQLHGAIEESGAVITYGELPPVWSEPAQLSQVFQNLLSNAIKYRKPDVVPRIHISCAVEGERATFCVTDNGMGFKQEYADRIFLLFQRLHGRAIPGTGIGLALSRRIVERHGGHIWARSEEGAGSSFYFTTPLASAVTKQLLPQ